MSYPAWDPPYRVTTISPGRLDLLVATYIDGRRSTVRPIMEYDDALAEARAFHRDHPHCQIKVLPLDGLEARNLFDIVPAAAPVPIEPGERRRMVDMLMGIARDSSDSAAKRDAFDLLRDLGVIQP